MIFSTRFVLSKNPSTTTDALRVDLHRLGVLALSVAVLASIVALSPADARGRSKRGAVPAVAAKSAAKTVAPAAEALQNLPPKDPFPEAAIAKTELSIGDLRATVSAGNAGGLLPVGGIAAATITITAAGGNRTAGVLVEAEGGEILALSGAGAKPSQVRAGLAADVLLSPTGSTVLNVEMGLKGGLRGADGKARNRLRVTMLPQKGGKDESILSWGLADCAGDYYAELQNIIETRRARMTPTLEAMFASSPDLPAKWMFTAQSTSPLLICKGGKGKKSAACTGLAAAKATNKQAQPAAWDEPRVLQLASDILASKGALPGFQKRAQPLRQVSNTLLTGLRVYMEQDAHPALCTGVDAMVSYYRDNTPFLRTALASGREALPAAQQLAMAKVAGLVGTPAAANGGSGVISTAQAAEPVVSGYVATDLVDRIAKAILNATDASETAGIKELPAKLEHMRALLDGATTADLAADKRSSAVGALRLIEASLYIATAAKKYADLDDAIYGTMSAIADAHKAKCVCQ